MGCFDLATIRTKVNHQVQTVIGGPILRLDAIKGRLFMFHKPDARKIPEKNSKISFYYLGASVYNQAKDAVLGG